MYDLCSSTCTTKNKVKLDGLCIRNKKSYRQDTWNQKEHREMWKKKTVMLVTHVTSNFYFYNVYFLAAKRWLSCVYESCCILTYDKTSTLKFYKFFVCLIYIHWNFDNCFLSDSYKMMLVHHQLKLWENIWKIKHQK